MPRLYAYLLLLLFPASVMAQWGADSSAYMTTETFGIKGGLNSTNLYFDGSPLTAIHPVHGGAYFSIPLNDWLNLHPELIYTARGADVDTANAKFKLHYVSAPLILQYNLQNFLKFDVGVQPALLIQAHRQVLTNQSPTGVQKDALDLQQNFDIGLIAGVSMHIQPDVAIGMRYNYSMSPIAIPQYGTARQRTFHFFVKVDLFDPRKQGKATYAYKKRQLARDQIRQLRDGALLVRLKTSRRKIKALRKQGLHEEAKMVSQTQHKENEEIVHAFTEMFDFCPVYFFYDTSTHHLTDRRRQGFFINQQMEVDPSIRLKAHNYFIAELAIIQQETGELPEEMEDDTESEHGGPHMRFRGLIIKDDKYRQLKSPFPYYVRSFDSIQMLERSKEELVNRLDEKLYKYFMEVGQ